MQYKKSHEEINVSVWILPSYTNWACLIKTLFYHIKSLLKVTSLPIKKWD